MKKQICIFLCMFLLFSALCARAETVRGNLDERFGNVPEVTWRDETYRLRSRLTTILVAGVDKRAETQTAPGEEHRSGGQADFLVLLVVDDNRDTIGALQINRDTMTEITVLSILGQETGVTTAQLALAHAFGDGGTRSCELAVSAVETQTYL